VKINRMGIPLCKLQENHDSRGGKKCHKKAVSQFEIGTLRKKVTYLPAGLEWGSRTADGGDLRSITDKHVN
jgi:hypothetical protein